MCPRGHSALGPGISEVAQGRAMGLSGWRGCLGTRLNSNTPEHAYCQENERLVKLPGSSMAQFCHSLDPAGGPGGSPAWLRSAFQAHCGCGVGGEWSTVLVHKGLPGPLSNSSHPLQRPRPQGRLLTELLAQPPFNTLAGACPHTPNPPSWVLDSDSTLGLCCFYQNDF